MSLGLHLSCDQIMDAYGSTCARWRAYTSTDLTAVSAAARADRWLIDSTGRTLCPQHSGIPAPYGRITIDPPRPLRPIR